MKLYRTLVAAAILLPMTLPAMALSIAVDPETGEPLANPPRIFLTLTDENGETAGDYVVSDFSFRLAPYPEDHDDYISERPRFSLSGIETIDAALLEWATATGDAANGRSATIQVLAAEEGGVSLTYTIEDLLVHYVSAYHVSNASEMAGASLELSGDALNVEEQVLQTIEN